MIDVIKLSKDIGVAASKLKLEDVQMKIRVVRRYVDENQREAVNAERLAREAREKAFLPTTPSTERSRLWHSAQEAEAKAKQYIAFTESHLSMLSNYMSLETTMKIVGQMQQVGLFDKNAKVDWQNALDEMQNEISNVIDACKTMTEIMNSTIMKKGVSETPQEVDDIEALFKKFDAEPDPVKKEEIRRTIEAKNNAALRA